MSGTALDLASTTDVARDYEFQSRVQNVKVPFYHYDLKRATAADIAEGCSRTDFIRLALVHCRQHALQPITYPETAIYVLEAEGWSKIGISRDPERRLKSIRGANWQDVRLHALFWTDEDFITEFETLCHHTASASGYERRREWFKMSPGKAARLIANCAKSWELRVADSGMWLVHRQLAEDAVRNFSNFGEFGRLTSRPN